MPASFTLHSTCLTLFPDYSRPGRFRLVPRHESPDPARNYDALSENGRQQLAERLDAWNSLVEIMNHLPTTTLK